MTEPQETPPTAHVPREAPVPAQATQTTEMPTHAPLSRSDLDSERTPEGQVSEENKRKEEPSAVTTNTPEQPPSKPAGDGTKMPPLEGVN